MNILVTGGTGFLGGATARRLREAGHAVTALGRNAARGAELEKEGIRFVRADLTEKEGVDAACRGQEAVIHSGALASPWGRYETFYASNVVGTKNVVAACLAHRVRRLVNLSTPSLYFDYRSRLGIKETDPLPARQVTNYGATKLLADREVEAAARQGLETIHVRPRAVFGPGDRTVLGRVIRAARKGVVPLVGGGRTYVDMTYLDNAVDAILLCLDAPARLLGRTYNVTNGEPLTARAMLELLFASLGMEVRFRPLPFPVAYAAAAAVEGYYTLRRIEEEPPLTRYAVGLMGRSQTLDISAARTELGYRPRVPLKLGFDRFARWWRGVST